MRAAIGAVVMLLAGCRQAGGFPVGELRRTVIAELPTALTSIVGRPASGAWRCAPNGATVVCTGGPGDSLTVVIESLAEDADGVNASAALMANGVSGSHSAPLPSDVFVALWMDRFRRVGGSWRRTTRTVNAIS